MRNTRSRFWISEHGRSNVPMARPPVDEQQRDPIMFRIERLLPFAASAPLLWNSLRRERLAGHHIDADLTGIAHEIMRDRAVPEFEPPATRRLPDDHLVDVVGLGEGDDFARYAPDAGKVTVSAPSASASRIVSANRSRSSSASCRLRRVSMLGRPGRLQPVRLPLAVAHESQRAGPR